MNKLPKIGLDIDGVLANFTLAWHEMYPEVSPTPDTWYFDPKIVERFEQMRNNNTLNDFYLNIKPLIKPEEIPFEPHCYITSRPVAKEITEEWLDINGFPTRPVISLGVRTSKVDAAKANGIEIFIDDFYENFVDLNNNYVFTYLYSAPWNTRFNVGHMRINSLNDLPFLK